jgi:hypothetical protein
MAAPSCWSLPMSNPTEPSRRTRLAAGATLVVASVAAVMGMAHHPTARAHDGAAIVDELARLGTLNTAVHGAMIVSIVAVWLALGEYSAWRGARSANRIAERLYGLGAAAMIGAALVNGFALDGLATNALAAGPGAMQRAARAIPLAWALNQALAGFGVFVLSGGIAAWSLAAWRDPGKLARLSAAYGVLSGAGVFIAYAAGAFRLDVAGMAGVVALHSAWYALVGLRMWRGATITSHSSVT